MPEPSIFQLLLAQIASDLDEAQIPYMVIGGQAVLMYGEPRLTRDIDITLAVGTEQLPLLLRLAADRGWQILSEDPAAFVRRTMVLPCLDSASGIRVDFIFSSTAYEGQAIERTNKVQILKTTVRFAAAEDVIVQKIVAGRARDLEDVRGIISKKQSIDEYYVRHWLKQFDLSLGEEYVKRFESIWTEIQR